MRGNGVIWQGVPNCTYTTVPSYLNTQRGLEKVGWKIADEVSARTAWCYIPMTWWNSRRYIYHIGYAVPLGGNKARQRRLEAGLSKERVRQIQKNYPKQISMFIPKLIMPNIKGNDIDPFDIDIDIDVEIEVRGPVAIGAYDILIEPIN